MEATTLPHSNDKVAYLGVMRTENGKEVEVGVIEENAPIRVDKHGTIYIPFIDDRALDYLAAQIKEMIVDEFDCVLMITGRRRIGKSNLGLQIARKVDPTFSMDSVAFHVDDFAALLDKNPSADPGAGKFPQAFYDEAGFGLFAKDWMHQWVKEVGKCLQVVGKKKNVCYFILPHIKKLVGDIRDEMAYIWIDIDFKYKHERGYAEVYMGVRDKHKQLIWWNPKCCFKYQELQGEFWDAYERKKDQFIDEIASGRFDKGHKSKDADRLNAVMLYLHNQGMSFRDIGKRVSLDHAQVIRRLQKHDVQQKEPRSIT